MVELDDYNVELTRSRHIFEIGNEKEEPNLHKCR